MQHSTDLAVEPGPADVSTIVQNTSEGARATRTVKFSVLTGVTDTQPIVVEQSWDQLAELFSTHDYRAEKLQGPLFSPAELVDGRKAHNVHAVHFGVLDLDGDNHEGVAAERFLDLLGFAARFDWIAYTTWSQPLAAQNNAVCARLLVPWSRAVLPHEWPTVRARFVAEFGGIADPKTDDMTRVSFTPSLPLGCEIHANVWRAANWQGGARAWDVDAALAAGPVLQPVPLEARDPIPRDALVRLAGKLIKSDKPQRLRVGQLLRTGLDGHQIAVQGERHAALRDMSWQIAEAFPAGSAVSIAEHFRCSLDFMRGEGVGEDPVKHFEALIESAQRKQHEERERKRIERAADRRPTITLRSARLEELENRAIEALAPLEVFQRAGELVHVTREATPDNVQRPQGSPTIRSLPRSRLRSFLDQVVRYEWVRDDGAVQTIDPPQDHVNAIAERSQWGHIRPLRGIVSFPIVRPDGSLLVRPGYDAATATLSSTSIAVNVADQPTKLDAEQAAGKLLELVADFPFADDAARAVWLAALLTPLARTAIDGPTPLTILDANAPGCGKSMLGSLVGRIVLGGGLPMRTAPESQEEWRKFLFAIVLSGDPLVLIDNVTRMVQSAAFDSILTSTTYGDRVLGASQDRSVPVRTSFLLSSNNAQLSSDLVRRSLHCRLESKVERPEQRSGFRFPNILAHVTEHRAEYLSAALTILRAYVVAGRPDVGCRPVGSYEAWSRIVAAPLVWLGLPDPAGTQDALREVADVERDDVSALLAAWFDVFPERAVTTRELVAAAETRFTVGQTESDTSKRQALRDALVGMFDDKDQLPATSKLGYRLRRLRGNMVGGLTLQQAGEARNATALWKVSRHSSS